LKRVVLLAIGSHLCGGWPVNTRTTDTLPRSLEVVRRRFEKWRRTRQAGSRIPKLLWTAAVKMAGIYGLHRTARALPVEYYSLKKHIELAAAPEGHRRATAFIELPPSMPIESCGVTLELKAAASPDLAALCRSFWNPAS